MTHDSHPWALVNQGIWRKYPNRECSHVISVDVLDRSIDPKTGILRTERVLGVRQKVPLWVLKVRFFDNAYICWHLAMKDLPVPFSKTSCLEVLSTLLFEKSRSLTQPQNEQHSRAKTSPSPNALLFLSKYHIPPRITPLKRKLTSISRSRYVLALPFGNPSVASWNDGVPNGSLKMRRKDA